MALKRCVACGEEKDESEFPSWWDKAAGHRRGTCRTCKSEQQKRWYEKNKETHKANIKANKERAIAEARRFVWDYLTSHPCVDCGESNPRTLEFDHVKGRKRMAVSEMVRAGYGIESIAAEISKCEVRCANCHRIKTYQERGWFSR
jgi:hypothetical protein